jgi:predicted PhzF superfamily epimerase YddE/YHI9
MPHTLLTVDAFTDRAFAGNPAAVCLLPAPAETAWMAGVAREMNLSETAFLVPREDGYDLRWFTPAVEVDLCGHATLASAHALWELGRVPQGQEIRFHTRSGLLTAGPGDGLIWLNFPARRMVETPPPDGLVAALGAPPRWCGRDHNDYLLELESEDEVRRIQPHPGALRGLGLRGVIVTARASSGPFDFVSRFFAPGAGIDEDPVTGSAHCALAPYWAAHLGKEAMLAYQASARGGEVRVRLAGGRVLLGGKAITVLRGELLT